MSSILLENLNKYQTHRMCRFCKNCI